MNGGREPGHGLAADGSHTPVTEVAEAAGISRARDKIDFETYNKLSKALTLTLGIDPVVVMKDIAGAIREQALDALEWSAPTLVDAALGTQTSTVARCGDRPRSPHRKPNRRGSADVRMAMP